MEIHDPFSLLVDKDGDLVLHALRTRSWSKDGDFAPYLFLLHVSHQLQSLRVHGRTFLQPDPCSLFTWELCTSQGESLLGTEVYSTCTFSFHSWKTSEDSKWSFRWLISSSLDKTSDAPVPMAMPHGPQHFSAIMTPNIHQSSSGDALCLDWFLISEGR